MSVAPILRGRSTVRRRPTTGPVPSSSSSRPRLSAIPQMLSSLPTERFPCRSGGPGPDAKFIRSGETDPARVGRISVVVLDPDFAADLGRSVVLDVGRRHCP